MTDFVNRVRDLCYAEWMHFGEQTYSLRGSLQNRGKKETDPGFWERVGVYWKMGTNRDFNGLHTDWPWSAAFISYIMRMAGAKDKFRYAIRHSDYIAESIHGDIRCFEGMRVQSYAPKIGDLVCYAQQASVSYDHLPKSFISHTDIVVDTHPEYIEVIGGNVGNSVSKRLLAINTEGILNDTQKDWLTIIQTKI